MGKEKCVVRQLRDYANNKGEIYAFINLIDENQENKYCLMYLSTFDTKNHNEKFWLALETVYMYLFVKNVAK